MPLVATTLAVSMKEFILSINTKEQADMDAAITAFCNKLEEVIYTAIKSQTITILPGAVITTGGNSGGPVVCTNVTPVIINGTIT